MKKPEGIMHKIDHAIDPKIKSFNRYFVKKYFVYFSSGFLILLTGLYFGFMFYQKPYQIAAFISRDLEQIHDILKAVDIDCNILSIKVKKITLDFFNVEKFSGSEVGGMNLAYPQKWKGPYMKIHPTINGVFYELIKAVDGVFIVPGNGSILPNGIVVGTQVQIKPCKPVAPLLEPQGALNFKTIPLGKKVAFKIGDWDSPLKVEKKVIDDVNAVLEEANDAMPYAQAEITACIG